ncbi:MAG: YkgJ family cysteine cluster protein [Deltaproteobacteria bacterium]|nr:YkgJ family cysteine cluster protein [Deltaproteobacteria bacterium]MBW2073412.1 YkgJ family cysteine cluster protein [Deltaproteobacteria bacterium]
MKKRLGIRSDEFLDKYTFSAVRDNPFFPSVMLRMAEHPQKPCPFLLPDGCSIYEDRPSSCRTYPLERAVARVPQQGRREDHYFLKHAPYCLGHQEEKEWTVEEWIANQEIKPYNEMNDLWVNIDTIFRTNPWGHGEAASKKLRMAFMACFNVDQFRRFVLKSSFRSRFDVSEERVEKMKMDDVEMMKFGFEWVEFFLTGRGALASRFAQGNQPEFRKSQLRAKTCQHTG